MTFQDLSQVHVLFVPADEAFGVELRTIDNTLEEFQAQVGGYIEGFHAYDVDDWFGYCDEEGKLKAKPVNVRATRLARSLGWTVYGRLNGDVFFVGKAEGCSSSDDAECYVCRFTVLVWLRQYSQHKQA
jgi:hypothetical protein